MHRDWGVTANLVESVPDGLTPVLELLSLPGDLVVIGVVLAALSAVDVYRNVRYGEPRDPRWSRRLAFVVAVVAGGLGSIVLLEAAFGLSRPPDEWHAIAASPYAFPSGHTMAATVCWGALGWWYFERTRPRLLAVLAVVGIVGFARLALGLHYVPDVLAGVGFGLAYLGIVGSVGREDPTRAFAIATVIALVAGMVTGASDRSVVAFVGTVVAFAGWIVLSRPARRGQDRH